MKETWFAPQKIKGTGQKIQNFTDRKELLKRDGNMP